MLLLQEENRILDKMHRQKVSEVEKLMQTVHELEEAVLAGGAAANAVRDYQRKMQELNVSVTVGLLNLNTLAVATMSFSGMTNFHASTGRKKNSGP